MPELLTPTVEVADSLRAAARAGGWETHPAYAAVGTLDDLGLAAWVETLRADASEENPRPEGFVPSTNLWWVEGQDYLGRVQIRHRLTGPLREFGGHVGYFVVPAHRRRGHATRMLAAALPVADALGLECVLVTCDVDNVASRKVIEAAGGSFEDQRGPKLRFWVPTGPPALLSSR